MKNYSVLLLLLFFMFTNAAQKKATIAVLNLKHASGVTKGEADIITDRLRIELFKTGNVDIMEREEMQTVLKEQGFQASGACSDEGCLVEMGQMLGVQFIVTGSIGKLGNLYLLNFRSIDIQTAKISKVVSRDIDGDIEKVVTELSDIAWQLTGSESKRKTVRKKTISKPVSIEEEEVAAAPPDCKDIVFLVPLDYKGKLSFSLDKETIEEINSDIKDAVEEAVENEIDDDLEVEILSPDQIAQLPADCKSGLVKAKLNSYSTRQSGSQNVGKAKASFYFYNSPRSEKPVFKITVEEEGDRHWGDQQPIENAFEEVSEELEDELGDSDYIDCLDPNKK